MGIKNTDQRNALKTINLDNLVPENHIIRKIDKAIDLSFIYDKVKHLYRPFGTESINPIVLYFSTFGKNYKRRFEGTDIFDEIFKQILVEVAKCNFLDEENIFVDGTHIKANANNKKSISKFVEVSTKFYESSLQEEISKDREINKKTLNFDKKTDINRIKINKTDSECGVFHKGEHKKIFAYSANTACDRNNFVLDFVLTPGNCHDFSSFAELYQQIILSYPNIKI